MWKIIFFSPGFKSTVWPPVTSLPHYTHLTHASHKKLLQKNLIKRKYSENLPKFSHKNRNCLPNYFRGQKGGKEKIPATCSKNKIHLFTEKSDLKVKTVKAGSLLVVLWHLQPYSTVATVVRRMKGYDWTAGWFYL